MSDDYLAGLLAKQHQPPRGRVHLHAFVKRNSLSRVAVYEDGDSMPMKEVQRLYRVGVPHRTVLDGELEWKVRTRASSVCKVPGRCILADIVTEPVWFSVACPDCRYQWEYRPDEDVGRNV